MIKHIVMWDVRGETEEEKQAGARTIKRLFEGLAGRIPGLRLIEVGIDTSRVSYACDVVLYAEFLNAEALEDYANHPAHLQVREAISGLRVARHQVDYSAGPEEPSD